MVSAILIAVYYLKLGHRLRKYKERLGHEDIKRTTVIFTLMLRKAQKKKRLKSLPNFWECNAQPLLFPLPFQKENHSHGAGMA